jgi:uncharacterized protein
MPEIVTEGSGWHEQVADRAELHVTVAGAGRRRADAVAELGRRVAPFGPLLERPGLTVVHRRLSVHDEWRGKRVTGARAAESLLLRLDDVTLLEDLLNGLLEHEPDHLDGPQWLLRDRTAARREAQRRAVADARDRAEGYAAALGGRLGPLLRLGEGHSGFGSVAMAASPMARGKAATPDVRELGLEPEPVRVDVSCTTAWELLP